MLSIVDWAKAMREIMENYAFDILKENQDNKTVLNLAVAIPVYKQEGIYKVGDIRRDPENDVPCKCILEYDAGIQPDWTIKNRTLWIPYHGYNSESALPWEAPTSASDIYKKGEWMVYTDGKKYEALVDTEYSPEVKPDYWKVEE